MALISAHNLSKSFGADDVFTGITVSIPYHARIALVGPNGCGKTTLLRLLARMDEPSGGTVSHKKQLTFGFLPQSADDSLTSSNSLFDEMLLSFSALQQMETELGFLANALASEPEDEDLLEKYGTLERQFDELGGYYYHETITQVLKGLGFLPEDFERPIFQLSGGQKTRALLARLLLEEPELLILDEPTNHLDIRAIEWLEGWLTDYEGSLLLVSHDRYFMDNVASHVWELSGGKLEEYRGNYSHYTRQRSERYELRIKTYKQQQEYISKEMNFIKRNMAGQNTRQAQGRQKRLERLLAEKKLDRPQGERSIHVDLHSQNRSGNQVIITENLEVGYADEGKALFKAPDIVLRRGECAALIGPNGAGKTTFIKTLLGMIPPYSGNARLGASVVVGYFAQAHERLDPEKTILEEILDTKWMPTQEARSLLGSYLFSGDEVFKPISVLSGGERGRVALAKLALSGANLLLLDEPTNHLDLPSQEILEQVLQTYDGTILLVSHDRFLINNLATQIWSLDITHKTEEDSTELFVFEGGYQEYLGALTDQQVVNVHLTESPQTGETKKSTNGIKQVNPYERERLIRALEAEINDAEVRLVDISGQLGEASENGNVALVSELGEQYHETETRINELMIRWEELLALE